MDRAAPGGCVYHGGDFRANLDRATDAIDMAGFADRRAESARRGRLRGSAAAPYVENDGGAPAALMGAVRDALPVPGTTTIDMPVTPEKVWRAIREARARPSGTASDA